MNDAYEAPLSCPGLRALRDALKAGDRAALHRFWRQVETAGTPLIRPIPDDPGHYLVTFLWRAREQTRTVAVTGGFNNWKLKNESMIRLPDTDLWYRTFRFRGDLRTSYMIAPDYPGIIPEIRNLNDWFDFIKIFRPDPYNPRTCIWPETILNYSKSTKLVLSMFELPGAPCHQWIDTRPGIPCGALERTGFRSDILGNERTLWIYTPPSCHSGNEASSSSCSLLLVCDGSAYTQVIPTPSILDNLLSEGKIPPMVAVFIGNATDQRHRELTCHPPFADFLARELVPWVRHHYSVTTDPSRIIIAGSSFGGLAAAYAGLRYPDVFGNILAQSGSFWWKPETAREYEWLPRQFETSAPLPLRFYLETGLLETKHMINANRHLRDILTARGYSVRYREFYGGHEYLNWQGTLADGLMELSGTGDSKPE
ncbi:enterochelin esterase [bacterium]|nr:enterochelin esterase [bacterium]